MDQALPLPTSRPQAWPLRLLGLADQAVTGLVLAAMAAMVAVVTAQVALRYGLNRSLDWADEIGRMGFVWSVFLAIPLGVREGAHIGIDLLVDKMPPPAAALLRRAGALLAAVLMALIAWAAVRVAMEQWDELMSTVDLSVGWFIVPVALGSALSALHLLRIAVQGPPAKRTGSAE
jgi:TRAP-type C4-dicarboxylate transport system permease small subunit